MQYSDLLMPKLEVKTPLPEAMQDDEENRCMAVGRELWSLLGGLVLTALASLGSSRFHSSFDSMTSVCLRSLDQPGLQSQPVRE